MKIPYPLTAAVAPAERYAQMKLALAIAADRHYGRLAATPITDDRTMLIACYGPSLLTTWETLRDQHAAGAPILSMSGATRFLADRGIIADYHLDMDPRAYKSRHLDPPIPGVHYLMASCCPPATWDLLRGERVTLWHTQQADDPTESLTVDSWVAKYDAPGQFIVHGGSTIGLTALHIAGLLGYRHLEIHGMDGSFAAVAADPANGSTDGRHAGIHFAKKLQPSDKTWDAEGRTYRTSNIMANAVAETINTVSHFPIFTVFHGDGLTQALIREANVPNACTANQTEKADRIRRATVRVLALPPLRQKRIASYWDAMIDAVDPSAVPELLRLLRVAQSRRALAKFNTGSISIETALQLRALSTFHRPVIIAEVGTFIGSSTYALRAASALYTCDVSNDCLPADPANHIIPHPYTTATVMFERMLAVGLHGQVDLFFFDGRLSPADAALIERLGHPRSIFAFDDCHPTIGGGKGLANLRLLQPLARDHAPIPPSPTFANRSTLGALVPFVTADAAAEQPQEQLQCA